MIKIVIADDHTMFVDGIESILKNETNIKVVDRCFNGKKVFDILKKKAVDVLLLDINLPELNGIQVAQRIQRISSGQNSRLIHVQRGKFCN